MKLQVLKDGEWKIVEKEVKVKMYDHFVEVYFNPNISEDPRGNYRLMDGKEVIKKQIKFIS